MTYVLLVALNCIPWSVARDFDPLVCPARSFEEVEVEWDWMLT